MKNLIETLTGNKNGYGHFVVTVELNGKVYSTTTTNTLAVDAAFDDCYDDEDRSGCFYKSRHEAQEALVSEVLTANELAYNHISK